jgi:hypothetical protein
MECNLGEGELIRLDGGRAGLVLRCICGTLWLTKGDGQDYLILPGRRFELGRGEKALAEALQPSELSLGEPERRTVETVIGLASC